MVLWSFQKKPPYLNNRGLCIKESSKPVKGEAVLSQLSDLKEDVADLKAGSIPSTSSEVKCVDVANRYTV